SATDTSVAGASNIDAVPDNAASAVPEVPKDTSIPDATSKIPAEQLDALDHSVKDIIQGHNIVVKEGVAPGTIIEEAGKKFEAYPSVDAAIKGAEFQNSIAAEVGKQVSEGKLDSMVKSILAAQTPPIELQQIPQELYNQALHELQDQITNEYVAQAAEAAKSAGVPVVEGTNH